REPAALRQRRRDEDGTRRRERGAGGRVRRGEQAHVADRAVPAPVDAEDLDDLAGLALEDRRSRHRGSERAHLPEKRQGRERLEGDPGGAADDEVASPGQLRGGVLERGRDAAVGVMDGGDGGDADGDADDRKENAGGMPEGRAGDEGSEDEAESL